MVNAISETSDALLTLSQTAEAPTEAGSPVEAQTLRRRERTALTDREIVAARLARAIGRGRDAIYHGTRAPENVFRSGKLIPSIDGVSFSRSPEVAAYFAHLMGREVDQWSPAVLVLDRSSLIQTYRLEPCPLGRDPRSRRAGRDCSRPYDKLSAASVGRCPRSGRE